MLAEIDRLRGLLGQQRDAALEEAAEVAKNSYIGFDAAAAIRKLKTEEDATR